MVQDEAVLWLVWRAMVRTCCSEGMTGDNNKAKSGGVMQ